MYAHQDRINFTVGLFNILWLYFHNTEKNSRQRDLNVEIPP